MGLVPRFLRRYMVLIFQRYTGDITLVPAATVGDYMRLLSNPTNDYVDRCIIAGESSLSRCQHVNTCAFLIVLVNPSREHYYWYHPPV